MFNQTAAVNDPDLFASTSSGDLAGSSLTLPDRLEYMNHREGALMAIEESMEPYRYIATDHPIQVLPYP